MVSKLEKNQCTGCWACSNVCPTKALTMKNDEEGFFYPSINSKLCINCNLCEKVCPSLNKINIQNECSEVYAAWSNNPEIRFNSTSGGIFSEIAIHVLQLGGYVCGAVYNDDNMVEHYITNKMIDIEKIRQSKYVQSDMNFIYQTIVELLDTDNIVLFCGSPCQCSGLLNYLEVHKKIYTNLIVVDFICRGANSPKVYKKFLLELEKTYDSKIKRVWFKNKTYGWNDFCTKIEFQNGKVYLEDRFSDVYIRGYIEANLYIRPSCAACHYKELPRIADITLGDFWGIQLSDQLKDTDKGTSLVMINNQKGEKLFDAIKDKIFYEKKSLEDAVNGNMCIFESITHSSYRQEFMKDIDKIDIIDNINRFLK